MKLIVSLAVVLGFVGCVSSKEVVPCSGKVRVVQMVPTGEVVEGEQRMRRSVSFVNTPEGCKVIGAKPHVPKYKRKQSDSLQ